MESEKLEILESIFLVGTMFLVKSFVQASPGSQNKFSINIDSVPSVTLA